MVSLLRVRWGQSGTHSWICSCGCACRYGLAPLRLAGVGSVRWRGAWSIWWLWGILLLVWQGWCRRSTIMCLCGGHCCWLNCKCCWSVSGKNKWLLLPSCFWLARSPVNYYSKSVALCCNCSTAAPISCTYRLFAHICHRCLLECYSSVRVSAVRVPPVSETHPPCSWSYVACIPASSWSVSLLWLPSLADYPPIASCSAAAPRSDPCTPVAPSCTSPPTNAFVSTLFCSIDQSQAPRSYCAF
mgnify:CR=1 FL=1